MAHNAAPDAPTPEELRCFINSMELPDAVKSVLRDRIYVVPEQGGLFTCLAQVPPGQKACARHDVVSKLLDAARPQPSPHVVCVGGRRRTGKSFSTSWAQATAISQLEGKPRCKYVCYLDCSDTRTAPLSGADMVLLQIALVHLHVPTVIDEFSQWPELPGAVQAFAAAELQKGGSPLPVRPLHFILQDSVLSYVEDVIGARGVLFGREGLGIYPRVLYMPQPSLQLTAALLSTYHPSLYPSSLLRVAATHGRSLDAIARRPLLPIVKMGCADSSDLSHLSGKYDQLLHKVVMQGAASQKQLGNDWRLADKLARAGYLQHVATGERKAVLSDPVLITWNSLQPVLTPAACLAAEASAEEAALLEAAAQPQLMNAEGKVLEVLARSDLVGDLLHALGLTGKGAHKVVWGWLNGAELDLLVYWEDGPVVLVSCKRTQSEQSITAFTNHIKKLQVPEGTKAAPASAANATADAIMAALLAPGSQFIMVGLSAHPVRGHRLEVEAHIAVEHRGKEKDVPCHYVPLLLQDLVKPLPAELVQCATPLSEWRKQ